MTGDEGELSIATLRLLSIIIILIPLRGNICARRCQADDTVQSPILGRFFPKVWCLPPAGGDTRLSKCLGLPSSLLFCSSALPRSGLPCVQQLGHGVHRSRSGLPPAAQRREAEKQSSGLELKDTSSRPPLATSRFRWSARIAHDSRNW